MRTDIHTPSRIIPDDYQEVGVWTMNISGIGDCEFIRRERQRIREHMERTQGDYAHVETSGSCQVCGNVQAIYLVLFHHAPSNTYIRVGMDCSQKLGMGGSINEWNVFRKNVQHAREAQAGKRKAICILADAGNSAAWDIYIAPAATHMEGCKTAGRNQFGDDNGTENVCICEFEKRWKESRRYEEVTITDIVSKLVKYGSISEKAMSFISSLLKKIDNRPIVEAQRQAEKDAAGPVPVGRVKMTGTVLSMKEVERRSYHYGDSGVSTKVLIKLENGSKVYGNRFANVEKGQTITFTASVEASKDDPKFGFFKRAKV